MPPAPDGYTWDVIVERDYYLKWKVRVDLDECESGNTVQSFYDYTNHPKMTTLRLAKDIIKERSGKRRPSPEDIIDKIERDLM